MRVLTEFIGGAALIMVFAYGMQQIIQYFHEMEKRNDDVQGQRSKDSTRADGKPD